MEDLELYIRGYCKNNRDISEIGDRRKVRQIINNVFKNCQNREDIFYENLRQDYPQIHTNFKKWVSNNKKKIRQESYQEYQTEDQSSQEISSMHQSYMQHNSESTNQTHKNNDLIAQRQTYPDNFCLKQQSDLDKKMEELKNKIKEEQNEIESICEQMKYLQKQYELKFSMLLESSKKNFGIIFCFMDQKNKQLEQLSQSDL
ncbi:hypothetical protein ABPG74_005839 [Tetrahymena malaccensis]